MPTSVRIAQVVVVPHLNQDPETLEVQLVVENLSTHEFLSAADSADLPATAEEVIEQIGTSQEWSFD